MVKSLTATYLIIAKAQSSASHPIKFILIFIPVTVINESPMAVPTIFVLCSSNFKIPKLRTKVDWTEEGYVFDSCH